MRKYDKIALELDAQVQRQRLGLLTQALEDGDVGQALRWSDDVLERARSMRAKLQGFADQVDDSGSDAP